MSVAPSPTAAHWPSEPGSGRGRSHGTSSREPFDRWFRYPAGFASDYVELLLDRLQLHEGTVIDCFAGSGVTGTAARSRGLGFAGIEAHPLMAELAQLKLTPTSNGRQVRRLGQELLRQASLDPDRGRQNPVTGEPDLVLRSFAPQVLRDLTSLRELIKAHLDQNPAAAYLKWALLATLRDVAGVKVGWPYQRPGVARRAPHADAMRRFEARVDLIADDLDSLDLKEPTGVDPVSAWLPAAAGGSGAAAQVIVGDSRDSAAWSQISGPAAACIASPPYLNNFDYADATRLELFFWGEVSTWAQMCRDVRSDMLTATTQQSSVKEKRAATTVLRARAGDVDGPVSEILNVVEAITEAKRRRERRSKEYDQVAPAYFVAMWDILDNLHRQMSPGASALWLVGDSAPYGVYLDTPRLIGEIAARVGFTFDEDVSLRERGNRWGQNADRHKVPLAERLIVMSKPAPSDRR